MQSIAEPPAGSLFSSISTFSVFSAGSFQSFCQLFQTEFEKQHYAQQQTRLATAIQKQQDKSKALQIDSLDLSSSSSSSSSSAFKAKHKQKQQKKVKHKVNTNTHTPHAQPETRRTTEDLIASMYEGKWRTITEQDHLTQCSRTELLSLMPTHLPLPILPPFFKMMVASLDQAKKQKLLTHPHPDNQVFDMPMEKEEAEKQEIEMERQKRTSMVQRLSFSMRDKDMDLNIEDYVFTSHPKEESLPASSKKRSHAVMRSELKDLQTRIQAYLFRHLSRTSSSARKQKKQLLDRCLQEYTQYIPANTQTAANAMALFFDPPSHPPPSSTSTVEIPCYLDPAPLTTFFASCLKQLSTKPFIRNPMINSFVLEQPYFCHETFGFDLLHWPLPKLQTLVWNLIEQKRRLDLEMRQRRWLMDAFLVLKRIHQWYQTPGRWHTLITAWIRWISQWTPSSLIQLQAWFESPAQESLFSSQQQHQQQHVPCFLLYRILKEINTKWQHDFGFSPSWIVQFFDHHHALNSSSKTETETETETEKSGQEILSRFIQTHLPPSLLSTLPLHSLQPYPPPPLDFSPILLWKHICLLLQGIDQKDCQSEYPICVLTEVLREKDLHSFFLVLDTPPSPLSVAVAVPSKSKKGGGGGGGGGGSFQFPIRPTPLGHMYPWALDRLVYLCAPMSMSGTPVSKAKNKSKSKSKPSGTIQTEEDPVILARGRLCYLDSSLEGKTSVQHPAFQNDVKAREFIQTWTSHDFHTKHLQYFSTLTAAALFYYQQQQKQSSSSFFSMVKDPGVVLWKDELFREAHISLLSLFRTGGFANEPRYTTIHTQDWLAMQCYDRECTLECLQYSHSPCPHATDRLLDTLLTHPMTASAPHPGKPSFLLTLCVYLCILHDIDLSRLHIQTRQSSMVHYVKHSLLSVFEEYQHFLSSFSQSQSHGHAEEIRTHRGLCFLQHHFETHPIELEVMETWIHRLCGGGASHSSSIDVFIVQLFPSISLFLELICNIRLSMSLTKTRAKQKKETQHSSSSSPNLFSYSLEVLMAPPEECIPLSGLWKKYSAKISRPRSAMKTNNRSSAEEPEKNVRKTSSTSDSDSDLDAETDTDTDTDTDSSTSTSDSDHQEKTHTSIPPLQPLPLKWIWSKSHETSTLLWTQQPLIQCIQKGLKDPLLIQNLLPDKNPFSLSSPSFSTSHHPNYHRLCMVSSPSPTRSSFLASHSSSSSSSPFPMEEWPLIQFKDKEQVYQDQHSPEDENGEHEHKKEEQEPSSRFSSFYSVGMKAHLEYCLCAFLYHEILENSLKANQSKKEKNIHKTKNIHTTTFCWIPKRFFWKTGCPLVKEA